MGEDSIDILLAAYNGEKYIGRQIQSILDQTYQKFRIIVRDDGSKDKTLDIIQEFIQKNPSKIILTSSGSNLGAIGNFSALMAHSQANYIMFSDQDDVWLEDKVAKTFSKMKEMEKKYGKMPLLVHTDLKVADENLNLLDSSFWHYTKLYPKNSQVLNKILVQNVVTGCTMLFNRPLLELALPIPLDSIMHDWWIALTASAFGKIAYIESPTILYRQHGKNTLGAKKFSNWKNIKEGIDKVMRADKKRAHQAKLFLARFQSKLKLDQIKLLEAYQSLYNSSWFESRYLMFKHRFFKNGFLRNMAVFFLEGIKKYE